MHARGGALGDESVGCTHVFDRGAPKKEMTSDQTFLLTKFWVTLDFAKRKEVTLMAKRKKKSATKKKATKKKGRK